ncbi:hypothetical protein D9613_010729 [Agrocybe pediades]|uniref:Uncharacterized protein n=1 Tax=Agrocybe pediades TaxID=84607 RepID=A0A8H4VLY3_9AGAR|nr:hypothetical protein D9613_010729 [Agrocybe pediades]
MLSSPPLGSSWLRSASACAFSLFVRPPPPRAFLHAAAAAAAVSAAAAPSPPWQSPPVACRPWRSAFIISPSSFIAFVGYSAAFVVLVVGTAHALLPSSSSSTSSSLL